MRYALLAFAVGVIVLQQQASLPSSGIAFYILIPCALAVACVWAAWRVQGVARRIYRSAALISIVTAAALAGFSYAGWRAEARLADALPPAWEGRDIELVGVIDELPQPVDRGTRFAFSVERVVTPDAIVPSTLSLAWYSGYTRPGSIDTPRDAAADAVPALHAGERWHLTVRLKRPHGTVNPQRLRCRGVAPREQSARNRLRPQGRREPEPSGRCIRGRADDYVARVRESIRTRMLAALEGRPYAGVIAALAIGDERAIPAEQWQLFNRTGIGHLISISGLHITFFATLIGAAVYLALEA